MPKEERSSRTNNENRRMHNGATARVRTEYGVTADCGSYLYADDLGIFALTEEELQRRVVEWQEA